MKQIDIQKDLYLCCPLLNKNCTKENCYINDGLCRFTVDYKKSQEYLMEESKKYIKNSVFCLEYDKETLKDMVLELQEEKEQIKIWLKEQSERLHNIAGDNFTTVGQAVYEEVLKKIEEVENENN